MRIISLIPGTVLGGVIHSNEPIEETLEDPLEGIQGDIRYTPCQAAKMRRRGIEIPESSIENGIDDDEYCDQMQDDIVAPRGALDGSANYWKDNFNQLTNRYEVPYMFDGTHSNEQKNTIRAKLAEFKSKTCVDLVELPWEEGDGPFGGKYQNVFSLTGETSGCWSYVGKSMKKQTVGLKSGCERSYVPLHEVMHGLGWWHEQQRHDAHKHIKIWRERCSMTDNSFRVNFDTPHITHHDDGTPYDFSSVMHYSPWTCANSSLPVITKPDGSPITLTKTDTFSEWDIKQINYIYDCKLPATKKPPTTGTTQSPLTTMSTEFCSDQTDGMYAHPDCTKFYECSHKKTYIKTCPNGLLFNSQFKYCDWAANVKCETSTTQAPTTPTKTSPTRTPVTTKITTTTKAQTTTKAPTTVTTKPQTTESTEAEKEDRNFCQNKIDGFYAHPICAKYYQCYHSGTTRIGQCQNGLIWNPNLNACDWPSNYNCVSA